MVSEEQIVPSEWDDKPISLQRSDVAASSKKALWLRVSNPCSVGRVEVGFNRATARTYRVHTEMVIIPLREFVDAQELRNPAPAPLHLWIPSRGDSLKATVCIVSALFACKCCDFVASDKRELFSHVEECHLKELCLPLTWKEMRERDVSLPSAIYKCSYCNFYVASEDSFNPTSAIISHIQRQCRKAPRAHGPVEIKFEIVDDIAEIRKNVLEDLPRVCKCKFCGVHLNEVDDRMRHLVNTHEGMLYSLK